MYHACQDAFTESSHVLASSVICQKLRWRLLSLTIACVSSHRLHVMFVMLHLRLHSFSHVASDVQSGCCNKSLFESISAAATSCMKRGAHLAVHRTDGHMYVFLETNDWGSQAALCYDRSRSSLGRTGTVEKLPAYAAERMLSASGLASALADRPMRQLEQLCTGPANAAGCH
jgi:hypothetical protein